MLFNGALGIAQPRSANAAFCTKALDPPGPPDTSHTVPLDGAGAGNFRTNMLIFSVESDRIADGASVYDRRNNWVAHTLPVKPGKAALSGHSVQPANG